MEPLPILRLVTVEGNDDFLLTGKSFFFGGNHCSATGPLPCLLSGRN